MAVLIVLILCVPLETVLSLEVYGKPRFRMRMVWLFGLVGKDIKRGKKKTEEKKKEVEGKQKRRRRISARTIFKILRIKGLLRQLRVLLKDLLRTFRIRDLGADFKVGLGNPADTGFLFNFIGPINFFLSSLFPFPVRVQPSFAGGAGLEGYLHGAVRLQPIQLVMPFLRFTFSLPAIRVIKLLVVSKWKRKS